MHVASESDVLNMLIGVNAHLKKFLVLSAITAALALGAYEDPRPSAMSTPATATSIAQPTGTPAENSDQPVDNVRNFEDFLIDFTAYTFRTNETVCWVNTALTAPQCAIDSETPMRVVLINS